MTYSGCRYPLLSTCVLLLLTLSANALAKNPSDHTSWGNNITIGPNDQASDVTCMGCTIRVRGQVAGDVTTVGGSIVIEDQGRVSGDVTAVAGNIRIDKEVKVAGDVTVVGGELRRDPEASVSGDVTALGGRGWVIPIILAPFVVLGLLVAFVVWLVKRLSRPALPPVPA